MAINTVMAEHQRISILIALKESPDYGANISMLSDVLNHYALGCSRDQLKTLLNWLEQNGYVKLERMSENTWVARITASGIDVADGRSIVPGIKRPAPRSA
ncbi:VpaChn25_0724 family phage protein [Pseudoalteromonas xiamenensis]